MRGKMLKKKKLSDSIMSTALYSFQLCMLYIFFTIIPFCLNMHPSCSSTTLNRPCIRGMVIKQINTYKLEKRMEKHSGEESGQR